MTTGGCRATYEVMPHPPRLDSPGAFHHVMNRAVGHRPFFETRQDIRRFLAFAARSVRREGLEIHAFSILSTHFHLLVRSPKAELSEELGWVENRYVRRFNDERVRPGPLVRNRFRSKRIDCLAYFANVVRYIDANAVDAGLVKRPSDYPFSSAAVYAGGRSPPWLHRAAVEDVACRLAAAGGCTPDVYARIFGRPLTSSEQLATERAIARGNRTRLELGPIAGAHPLVRMRFASNAAAADGVRICSPIVDVDAIETAVREAKGRAGPATICRGTRSSCDWELVRVGLLHDLAGESEVQIAERLSCSRSRVRDLLRHFRRELSTDPATGGRVHDVLRWLPPAWSEPI